MSLKLFPYKKSSLFDKTEMLDLKCKTLVFIAFYKKKQSYRIKGDASSKDKQELLKARKG